MFALLLVTMAQNTFAQKLMLMCTMSRYRFKVLADTLYLFIYKLVECTCRLRMYWSVGSDIDLADNGALTCILLLKLCWNENDDLKLINTKTKKEHKKPLNRDNRSLFTGKT